MTNTVRNYIYAYGAGLIFFLITLFIRELSVVYMGLYFLVGLAFLFTFNQPANVPERSTITHFETASRWNAYSYILSAALVVAALLISFAPLQPNLTTAIVWTLSAVGLYGLTKFYSSRLLTNIIADYIKGQIPATTPRATEIVSLLQREPGTTSGQISSQFGITPPEAERLIYLYRQYVKNNLLAGDTFEQTPPELDSQTSPAVSQPGSAVAQPSQTTTTAPTPATTLPEIPAGPPTN